ncbi:MAG: hypothetical protein RIC19_01555 [Phaeodactylibacter sp.]|uniref:hypothetical protein n=1 Tax=Phaeodactylibacter sp. TaxID=1940289 RepID=UPI0032EAC4DC
MNLLLRAAGLWLCLQSFAIVQMTGQADPQWLFAGDGPGQQAYHPAYIVGAQTGAWAFSARQLESVTSVYPGEEAGGLYVAGGGPYGSRQKWALNFLADTLHSAILNGGQFWNKVPGTKGLICDTTAFYLSPSSTAAMDSLLALTPGLSATPERRRLSLISPDGKRQFAYLLNTEGWPIAEAGLQDGALFVWRTYQYSWDGNGKWDHRLEHNQLSGQPKMVERRIVQTKGQASGWMAVQGGAACWLLAENGHARYWDGQSAKPLPGTWRQQGDKLQIQRGDQRDALVYEVKEKNTWGWQVVTPAGHLEDWVWLNALQPEPRKLQRWREGAKAAHLEAFTEKGRTGLRASDGRVVLPAAYDGIEPVHPRLAVVELEERFGLVQTDGRELLPIYFEKLEYLGDSLLLAQYSGAQGILHLSGDTLVPFAAYERLIPRDDSNYWAFAGGEMGLIDDRAAMLISPQFDLIHPFFGNQAVAVENGQTGVIDARGQWVVPPGRYAGLTPVGLEGYLVQTPDNYWGFINRKGQLQVPLNYGHLRALAPGVLVGQERGRFGLIRTSGEVLAPLRYRMLKGCGDYTTTDELCYALTENNAVAQFVSDDRFGYLDARGQEHPPVLPTPAGIETDYQVDTVEQGLILTFPKKWKLEESIQKLYKQGDYGQSRVVYEFLPANGQSLEDWVVKNIEQPTTDTQLGGRAARTFTERERVQYYDFFRKHLYCLSADGQTVIHLEFSCKDANFLESIPHLYEIEQLIRFAGR